MKDDWKIIYVSDKKRKRSAEPDEMPTRRLLRPPPTANINDIGSLSMKMEAEIKKHIQDKEVLCGCGVSWLHLASVLEWFMIGLY